MVCHASVAAMIVIVLKIFPFDDIITSQLIDIGHLAIKKWAKKTFICLNYKAM